MLSRLLSIALLSVLAFGVAPKADLQITTKSPLEKQHAATHRVKLVSIVNALDKLTPNAHCSATAVSPFTLLTAGHCITNTNILYLDDEKKPTTILAEIPDGYDHILYIVDRNFPDFLSVTERPLIAKEPVHFWGNPGHSNDVYREGFYIDTKLEEELNGRIVERFILPAFGGDSGSGIMDANGNVVAVVSLGDESAEEWSLPLSFTAVQFNVAGVKSTIVPLPPPTPEDIINKIFGDH
jgi:hypothetical protein